jgi:hypothetical protein
MADVTEDCSCVRLEATVTFEFADEISPVIFESSELTVSLALDKAEEALATALVTEDGVLEVLASELASLTAEEASDK